MDERGRERCGNSLRFCRLALLPLRKKQGRRGRSQLGPLTCCLSPLALTAPTEPQPGNLCQRPSLTEHLASSKLTISFPPIAQLVVWIGVLTRKPPIQTTKYGLPETKSRPHLLGLLLPHLAQHSTRASQLVRVPQCAACRVHTQSGFPYACASPRSSCSRQARIASEPKQRLPAFGF